MEDRRGATDIEDWNFRFIEDGKEELEKMLKRGLREGLDLIFNDAYLQFALLDRVEGRTRKVADPLTLYFFIDNLGVDGEDRRVVSWSMALGEMLDEHIEDCEQDGSCAAELTRISSALRELADRIDAAVPKTA